MAGCRPLSALVTVLVVAAPALPAAAGHLILSANDGKYPNVDGAYQIVMPPPPDTLTVLDAGTFPPKVVGEIEVTTSVIGPPMGVALTPDEKLALVSCPMRVDTGATPPKLAPANELEVVDLEASPPAIVGRVAMPSRPCGLSISRSGRLALVAHGNGTVSVVTISGKTVTVVGQVRVGDEKTNVGHVAISPDEKWALASKRQEGTVAVLSIDGTKVEYTKRDVMVGPNPYGLDITADGKLGVVASTGHGQGDADIVSLIDMTARPIRAIDHFGVGQTPEGMALSPDGLWLAVTVMNGTNKPRSSPFHGEHGSLMIFALKTGRAVLVGEAPTGKNTQGVTFTPDGGYVLVQNYVERELAAYKLGPRGPEDTGVRIPVRGYPASIRIAPR